MNLGVRLCELQQTDPRGEREVDKAQNLQGPALVRLVNQGYNLALLLCQALPPPLTCRCGTSAAAPLISSLLGLHLIPPCAHYLPGRAAAQEARPFCDGWTPAEAEVGPATPGYS